MKKIFLTLCVLGTIAISGCSGVDCDCTIKGRAEFPDMLWETSQKGSVKDYDGECSEITSDYFDLHATMTSWDGTPTEMIYTTTCVEIED
ncbi:MAG: hypothetical protein LBR28_01320 [Bacteroidales bacterium]|jgi:hypothetical protein|nr:hypothetical protein [Bacteroidales bacterium]